MHVYVMELSAPEGAGYISVHRTYEGAWAVLQDKIDAWGLRDYYDLSEYGLSEYGGDENSVAADYEDFSYGISRLEVNE